MAAQQFLDALQALIAGEVAWRLASRRAETPDGEAAAMKP